MVVTDGSGRPVRGLRRDDFDIAEDGNRVEIATFTAVDLPEAKADPLIPAPESSGSAFASNDAPDDGRLLLIALDDYHASLSAGRMATVKSIARRAVERLGPADRAGVVTLSGRPGGQAEFTSDKSRLLRAIDAFVPQSEYDAPAIATAEGQRETSGSQRVAELRTIAAMLGLSRAVREIAPLPHRHKAVLLVSQGLPASLEEIIRDPKIGAAADSIQDFMGNARMANVTIYTFDPCGLEVDRGCTRQSRRSLETMAESSGGFAITNVNSPDAGLDRMFAESGAHYLIGYYSPAPPDDGKRHRIAVRTDAPGAQVRARDSYVALKPARRPRPAAPEDTLIFGPLQTPGLPLRVVAIPAPLAEDPSAAVIVGIEVPSAAARQARRLDFTVVAIDEEGKTRARLRFNTSFATLGAASPAWTHTGSRIDIPPGRYQIRVAAVGGDKTRGSVFTEVEVPKFAADLGVGGLSLGAPAPDPSDGSDRLRGVLPLIPFATREVPFRSRMELQVPIRVSSKGASTPLTITTTLIGSDGGARPLDRRSGADASYAAASGHVYRVAIPPDLPPGSYRIVVETARAQTRINRELSFRIAPPR